MMKILPFFLLYFLFSCGNKKTERELELEILNNSILAYSKNSEKDTLNIVEYSLKNYSDKILFINNLTEEKSLRNNAVFCNGINLHIFDINHKEEKYYIKKFYSSNPHLGEYVDFMMDDFVEREKKLGNNSSIKFFGLYERNNIFFIHPNETLYFYDVLSLKKPSNFDRVRQGFVDFKESVDYRCNLTISSDSTNYQRVLPRDILQTIKNNNVKVYHGIIRSKNTIPVKVIE